MIADKVGGGGGCDYRLAVEMTVLSASLAASRCRVINGSGSAIDIDRCRSHAKKFSAQFANKIKSVAF